MISFYQPHLAPSFSPLSPRQHYQHHRHTISDDAPSSDEYTLYDQQRSALERQHLATKQQERRSHELAILHHKRQVQQQQQQRIREEEEQQRAILLHRRQQADRQRLLESQLQSELLRWLVAGVEDDVEDSIAVSKEKEIENEPIKYYQQSIPTPTPAAINIDRPAPLSTDTVSDPILQQHFQSHLHRRQKLTNLSTISSDLSSHQSSFVSPTTLIFSTPSTSSHASDNEAHKLAFSSKNATFLAYEDYLVGLLSKVDAIESEGDQLVKEARKELVKRIESELERLDAIREASWKAQNEVVEIG